MNSIEKLFEHSPEIEKKIGYQFKNTSHLILAFIHRSFINEHKQVKEHNERLEFLGDSVLGLIISEFLYNRLPETPEGDLSYLRSRLIEATSCINYLQHLKVANYILLGKGERMNGGKGRESILSDLFEAIVGAIFLDGGLIAAKQFLLNNFSSHFEDILKTPLRNWKALLQDYCQKQFQQTPIYTVLSETGPDHSKIFEIAVVTQDKELARGTGSSKKEAQQAAALNALKHFEINL